MVGWGAPLVRLREAGRPLKLRYKSVFSSLLPSLPPSFALFITLHPRRLHRLFPFLSLHRLSEGGRKERWGGGGGGARGVINRRCPTLLLCRRSSSPPSTALSLPGLGSPHIAGTDELVHPCQQKKGELPEQADPRMHSCLGQKK